MKVTKNQVDDLNMIVSIALEKEDWTELKKKKLNEYRRNADIRGFRRGMAPMPLIEKIEAEMKKIVKEDIPLERFELPRSEAIKLMEDMKEPYKVELIRDLPED